MSTKSHEYLILFEYNQSFYSIAEFFFRFTTLSERKISLQEEKCKISSRRIGVELLHFKIFSRIPVTVTVTAVRDRKILPAPGPKQMVGFQGCRPITEREKIK